jgi:uncharacterized repeat protein (TIGR01451 family)
MKTTTLGFGIAAFIVLGGLTVLSMPFAAGQLPPGKITRQETPRQNPLRTPQLPAKPVAAPAVMPGTIQQTALQTEEGQPSFAAFPVVTESAPPADLFAPAQQEPLPVAETPSLAMPQQLNASPLASADPFAPAQPQAAVPAESVSNASPKTAAALRRAAPPQQQQSGEEGTGTPGVSALEGQQTPHLTIQKVLPDEVIVEQPATLKFVIQNAGQSTAKNVTITDRIPQGTRLLATIPEAAVSPTGELTWSVGNLDPNVQLIIEMKVLPIREGEIGSVATVNYTGEASARIAVTRPMLKVDVKAPAEIQLGEVAQIEITISNPGTASANNIVLEEHIPDGLFHKDGRVLRNTAISSLKPRESKKLVLPLICTGAGNLINHVIVSADGNLSAEDKTTIRANAPVLSLEIVGAKQRFLERKSEYRLVVANKGTAAAQNVDLELALPSAVQFVSTNQSGVYEPATHTVHWALEELPPQEAGEIELAVIPVQTGDHSLRFTGSGANNLQAEAVLPMTIDGIPAISFEIAGDATLVEIGKDAVYEVRVVNRGTKAAGNVKVWTTLPDGMAFIKAEGGRYQANGGTIQFETIPQLLPKSEKVYKVAARSQTEGDFRVNIQVISDDLRSPITKEESTKVFR